MNHLYDEAAVNAMIARLEKLAPNAKRVWGTMSVAQMLVHLELSIEPALGLQFPKRKLVGKILGPLLKEVYLNSKPLIKNSPTNDTYLPKGKHEFEEAKQNAMDRLKLFYEVGPDQCKAHPHPYFGKLSPQEWARLQWKHYDHHLRQFGV